MIIVELNNHNLEEFRLKRFALLKLELHISCQQVFIDEFSVFKIHENATLARQNVSCKSQQPVFNIVNEEYEVVECYDVPLNNGLRRTLSIQKS